MWQRDECRLETKIIYRDKDNIWLKKQEYVILTWFILRILDFTTKIKDSAGINVQSNVRERDDQGWEIETMYDWRGKKVW